MLKSSPQSRDPLSDAHICTIQPMSIERSLRGFIRCLHGPTIVVLAGIGIDSGKEVAKTLRLEARSLKRVNRTGISFVFLFSGVSDVTQCVERLRGLTRSQTHKQDSQSRRTVI